MAKQMANPPLFYTLAQIKFNPIEQMELFVPGIQESLRAKYPDFRKEVKREFLFTLNQQAPNVSMKEGVYWSFTNIDKTEGYLLSSEGLVFHTTEYSSFDAFSKKIVDGFALVDACVKLSYVERVGMRYLNAVYSQSKDKLEHYLNPALLGFSAVLTGKVLHNSSETVLEIEEGKLVAKTLVTEKGLVWPPDLKPTQLAIKKEVFSNVKTAIVDLDYFIEQRSVVDKKKLKQQLLVGHEVIKAAFQQAVTDHAGKQGGK